ncbi:MAG: CehA/McbA family metallohydrolase [Kofleriaceae bacterium]
MKALALGLVLAGCAGPARDPARARAQTVGVDAGPPDGPVDAASVAPPAPPRWLRGSTHVHAAPSGDSSTDPAAVVAWYQTHGYDFIVLTDHNRVTVPGAEPGGRTAAAAAGQPLVIAGVELTYNPGACVDPAPPPGGKCRIHVNALGVTGRPRGRIEWADRAARARRPMYQAAIAETARLGGLVQINHPSWHWGMTGPLLATLAGDGAALVEIANVQFSAWNAGDATHPSTEALWDQALLAGARLWAVASDDAHSYDGHGTYPAGGAWVMVDATPDADAIIAALAAGRFYATTGVALRRAGVEGEALVVEVAGDPAGTIIEVIVDGQVVARDATGLVRFPIPPSPSYVRGTVVGPDGARAWVQPARR